MRDLIAIHTKVNPSSPGGSDWLRLIRTLITHPSACLSLIIYSGMAAEPIDPAVGQAPIIISQTGSAPIPPNASFELFVEAEGASPLTYQWLFNQEPISGADQSRRIFERFTPDQVGHYKVVVSNPHGSVTSDPMIMTLNPALIQEGVVIDWETPYESLAGSDASPVRAFHDGNGGGLTVGTAFWENRLKSRFLIAAYDQAGKQRWVALPEYSSTSREEAYGAILLPSGLVVAAGICVEQHPSNDGAHLTESHFPFWVATSPSGEEQWRGVSTELIQAQLQQLQWWGFTQDSQGHLYLLGQAIEGEAGQSFLLKIDPQTGQTLWLEWLNFGPSQATSWDHMCLALLGEDQIIIGATGRSEINDNHDSTLLILNQHEGQFTQNQPQGLNLEGLALDQIRPTLGGNIFLIGHRSDDPLTQQIEVWMTTPDGQSLWRQILALPGQSLLSHNQSALDQNDNLVLTGQYHMGDQGSQILMAKISTQGEIPWFQLLPQSLQGASDKIGDLAIGSDNAIYLLGDRSSSQTGSDIATFKFSATGQLVYEARFSEPGTTHQSVQSIEYTSPESLMITGQTQLDDGTRMITLKQSPTLTSPNLLPSGQWDPSPFEGTLAGPGQWQASFDAWDEDGTVVQVEFLQNQELLATVSEAPFLMDFEINTSGTYHFYARIHDDQGGVAISDALEVDVVVSEIALPFFTREEQSLSLLQSSTITLDPGLTGKPPLRLQWYLNEQALAGERALTLTVSPEQDLTQAGRYTLRAQNDAGLSVSSPMTLTWDWPLVEGGDSFAAPTEIEHMEGSIRASNWDASRESEEPLHAQRPGGHSIWYRWRPNQSGSTTISLKGSAFDTLLAVYAGTAINQLTQIGFDDDSAGRYTSEVSFQAVAGVDYLIAIDGFNGDRGNLLMRWFQETNQDHEGPILPRALVTPGPLILPETGSLTLDLDLRAPGATHFQWLLNGQPIVGANQPVLTLEAGSPRHAAGSYSLAVLGPGIEWVSSPITVSLDWPVMAAADDFTNASTIDGLAGQLLTNNQGMRPEADEPHQSQGGHSIWFKWRPDADGLATLSLEGSAFDTWMGVYQGERLDQLELVAWDDDGAHNATSRIEFDAYQQETYHVLIDGFAGESGAIMLSWDLESNASRFNLSLPSESETLAIGESLNLQAQWEGLSNPLQYQWFHNGLSVEGATSLSLNISDLTREDAGCYWLEAEENGLIWRSPNFHLHLHSQAAQPDQTGLKVEDKFVELMRAIQANPTTAPSLDHDNHMITALRGAYLITTYGNTRDRGEPIHDQSVAASTSWVAYQPPYNGYLKLQVTSDHQESRLMIYKAWGEAFSQIKPAANLDHHLGSGGLESFILPVEAKEIYFLQLNQGSQDAPWMEISFELDVGLELKAMHGSATQPILQITTPPGIGFLLEGSPELNFWTPVLEEKTLDGIYRFEGDPTLEQSYQYFRIRATR